MSARVRFTRPGARRLSLAALALLLLAAPALGAQGAPRQRDGWRTPRVLKWTLLAASVGAGLWAWSESRQANEAYADLRRYCQTEFARCDLAGGAYVDPRAESLYRLSNDSDRRARIGLIGGQVALLGSAAFFILDLGRGGPPENIPYDPDRRGAGASSRLHVGVRLALPRSGGGSP
jgi:hypothetical protein